MYVTLSVVNLLMHPAQFVARVASLPQVVVLALCLDHLVTPAHDESMRRSNFATIKAKSLANL